MPTNRAAYSIACFRPKSEAKGPNTAVTKKNQFPRLLLNNTSFLFFLQFNLVHLSQPNENQLCPLHQILFHPYSFTTKDEKEEGNEIKVGFHTLFLSHYFAWLVCSGKSHSSEYAGHVDAFASPSFWFPKYLWISLLFGCRSTPS